MATVGKPVRIVSISFPGGTPLEAVAAVVEREAARGTDLIALPEAWHSQRTGQPEPLDGPAVSAMAALARTYRTYVVCPIERRDGDCWFNSAVLIDRDGAVAAVYDKIYPYWSEFDREPPVIPGSGALVVETGLGRIGLAICFDVNFPTVWQAMADQEADLVVWSSAYSGGQALQAYATLHHYPIVTSTLTSDCQIFDITGSRMLDEQSEGIHVSRATLDLDRGIYHHNFNLAGRDRLLRDHGDQVEQEAFFPREHWFVLRATAAGVSARALARDYGLEELRHYKARSRRQIDERREATPRHANLASTGRA